MISFANADWSLRGILHLLLRHKKKIVFVPLAAVALGLLVIVSFPRTYRSQAKIFLQVGRESVGIDPTSTVGQTMPRQQSGRDDEIQSSLEVIRSRGVIAAAVDRLGPAIVLGEAAGNEPAEKRGGVRTVADSILAVPRGLVGWIRSLDPVSERELAIVTVERSMDAGAGRDSAVIVLNYDAPSPQLAQQVCGALIEAYQQEHLRIHRNPEASDFFENQRQLLREQLDSAEQQLRAAKDELGLTSVDGRRTTLELQYSSVALSRYETQQQIASAGARVADLEKQLGELPERMVTASKSIPNQGADMLRDQYYALQLKEMDLKARYSDSHPLVQTVSQQAADARRVIEGIDESRLETTDEINPLHRELTLELKKQRNLLAGLTANLKELDAQEARIQADLKALNQSEVRIAQMDRETELARGKYMQYANYFEEARIDRDLLLHGISNVRTVQPPSLQEKPVAPSKMLVALATMFLATFGTAALVLTSEQLQALKLAAARPAVREAPVSNGVSKNGSHELELARNGG